MTGPRSASGAEQAPRLELDRTPPLSPRRARARRRSSAWSSPTAAVRCWSSPAPARARPPPSSRRWWPGSPGRSRCAPTRSSASPSAAGPPQEWRERVTARIGGGLSPTVTTFHSFAYALVRAAGRPRGVPRAAAAAVRPRAGAPAARAARRRRPRRPGRRGRPTSRRRSARGAWRPRCARSWPRRGRWASTPTDLEALAPHAGALGPAWRAVGEFLDEYLDVLDAEGVTDYTELVHRAALLAHDPVVQPQLRERYRAVFVDEYQDTDPAQVRLLRGLVGPDDRPSSSSATPTSRSTPSGAPTSAASCPSATPSPRPRAARPARRAALAPVASARCSAMPRRGSCAPVARPAAGRGPAVHRNAAVRGVGVRRGHGRGAHLRLRVRRGRARRRHAAPRPPRAGRAVGRHGGARAQRPPVDPAAATGAVRGGGARRGRRRRAAAARRARGRPAADACCAGGRRPRVARRRDRPRSCCSRRSPTPTPPTCAGWAGRCAASSARPTPAAGRPRRPPWSARLVERLAADPDAALPVPTVVGPRRAGQARPRGRRALARLLREARAVVEARGSAEEVLWAVWSGTAARGGSGWPQRLEAAALRGGDAGRRADSDLDAVLALFAAAERVEERYAGVAASPTSSPRSRAADPGRHPRRAGRARSGRAPAHRAPRQGPAVAARRRGGGAGGRVARRPPSRARCCRPTASSAPASSTPPPAAVLIAEERRLFYVACTRAQERSSSPLSGRAVDDGPQPSRFLADLRVATGPRRPRRRPPRPSAVGPRARGRAARDAVDPRAPRSAAAAARRRSPCWPVRRPTTAGRSSPPPTRTAGGACSSPRRDRRRCAPTTSRCELSGSQLVESSRCPLQVVPRARGARRRRAHHRPRVRLDRARARRRRGPRASCRRPRRARRAHRRRSGRELGFEAPWQSRAERVAASESLRRFLAWHGSATRAHPRRERARLRGHPRGAGGGAPASACAGPSTVVELDDDGAVHVPTSRRRSPAPRGDDVEQHLQLGVYQVVVRRGAARPGARDGARGGRRVAVDPAVPRRARAREPRARCGPRVQPRRCRPCRRSSRSARAPPGSTWRCAAGRRRRPRRRFVPTPGPSLPVVRLRAGVPGERRGPGGAPVTAASCTSARAAESGPTDLRDLVGVPLQRASSSTRSPRRCEPDVIVAGAGSGKTTVMTARVVWLVDTGQVPPDQVLGLTFTNKAAGELAGEVRESPCSGFADRATGADDDELGEPTIATYHAFAGRLIVEHGLRIGVEPAARLLAEAASVPAGLPGRVPHRRATWSSSGTAAAASVGDAARPRRRPRRALRRPPRCCGPTTTRWCRFDAEAKVQQKAGRDDGRRGASRGSSSPPGRRVPGGQVRRATSSTSPTRCASARGSPRSAPRSGAALREQFRGGPARRVPGHLGGPAPTAHRLFGGRAPGHRRRRPAAGDLRLAGRERRTTSTRSRSTSRARRRRARRHALPLTENRRSAPRILDVANEVAAPLRASTPRSACSCPVPPRKARRRAALAPGSTTYAEEIAWVADRVAARSAGTARRPTSPCCAVPARTSRALQRALVERDVPVEVVGTTACWRCPRWTRS